MVHTRVLYDTCISASQAYNPSTLLLCVMEGAYKLVHSIHYTNTLQYHGTKGHNGFRMELHYPLLRWRQRPQQHPPPQDYVCTSKNHRFSRTLRDKLVRLKIAEQVVVLDGGGIKVVHSLQSIQ